MNPALAQDAVLACQKGVDAPRWEARLQHSPALAQPLLGEVVNYWCRDPLSAGRGSLELASLLIRHGANPLAGEAPIFSRRLCASHPDVAIHLVRLLAAARANQGLDLRADDGGNALHGLVKARPDWLGNMLESAINQTRLVIEPAQTMSLPSFAALHPQWIIETDLDGATPLHAWWGHVVKECAAHDYIDQSLFSIWDVTAYLLRAGATLDARDHQGITPAHLIVQAVDLGLDEGSSVDVLNHARTVRDSLALQEGTAFPSSSRPQSRL